MPRKKKPDQRKTPEPIPSPPLYPIEEALLSAFSLDPQLQEQPASAGDRKPNILDPDDWLEDKRDSAAARPATGDQREEQNGNQSRPSDPSGDQRDQRDQRLHVPEPSPESVVARPRDIVDAELAAEARTSSPHPDSRDAELMRLPVWQRRYVLGLRIFGVNALAAQYANVSNTTVDKYKRESPLFAEACRHAMQDNYDGVVAATIQSATVGDVEPVFQAGLLVGHRRRKNVKAAELLMKKAGDLEDKPKEQARNQVQVDLVAETALATVVASAMTALYEARLRQPLLDAETGRPVER